jgi:predicted nucleotidyltransferase
MDLAEPGRGLAGGLTMPILRALAGRSSPATAAQVSRLAEVGTEAGVRRALERLAAHGVCSPKEVGGRIVYTLNYDHLLYGAVAALLDADRELPRRLKNALGEWEPAPVSAVLFGSAARRDGDVDSDVDLLLVRPPLRTETRKREWVRQVHELRAAVHGWTGNRLQVLDWTSLDVRKHERSDEPLVDSLLDEGVTVAGSRLASLLERSA